MKKTSILLFLFSLTVLAGCYKTSDKMGNTENNIVLSYPAVNQYNLAASGIDYWHKALLAPNFQRTADTVLLSVNIRQALNSNITINVGVDKSVVEAYNKDTLFGSAQYAMMPDNYYTILTPQIILPPGVTDSVVKVEIKPSLFDISQTGYLLPVSITSVEGIAVSPMKTAYLHVEKAEAKKEEQP